jgi:hypothetical protein
MNLNGYRRIFYDKVTGEMIGGITRNGSFIDKTVDQDIATFTALSERNRDTFDVIELPFGAYQQDFAECNGYRVNVETKTLEFSYPDPNAPEAPPVFVEPLTEQVKKLEAQTKQLNDDFLSLSDYVTTL